MKKLFRAALVLPLVLFAVSCSESNDDGGNDKPVILSPETKQEQQVYADDQQAPAPIKFTATAPWTATVVAVPTKAEVQAQAAAGSQVDWLTLSAYKGGAGEVSLTMTLEVNTSGQDRKAEIRIACGGTIITISVEQKGTTEQGEVPEDPENPAKPEPIELTGETPTQQTVWADETQTPKNIAFKTTAAWTATVAEVAVNAEAGKIDWLTLSAYSGGAGDASLTATLLPNYTGKDRKAEIRIVCGDKTVVLTVEQKATKADGTQPEDPNKPVPANYALVESIEVKFWVGCEEPGNSKYNSRNNYVFRYDDRNRVAEYEFSDYDYNNGKTELDYRYTTRFDYAIQGEIRLTEKTTYDPNSSDQSYTETYRILLDGQGRATQIAADKSSDEPNPITYHFAYNDEGRLSRISWYDPNESPTEIYEAMTYQNGVLSKVVSHYDDLDHDEFVFPADAFSDRPNDRLNIDPNWLLFTDPAEPQEMLPMLRLTGKSCDRLTLWTPNDEDNSLSSTGHGPGWPEPNVTVHKTNEYYEHEKTDRLQYTFNEDGTIATIVQPIVCIKKRYEYDIVAGNELVNPSVPELGYVYTIKNETEREVGRSTDKHEWTFTYRK